MTTRESHTRESQTRPHDEAFPAWMLGSTRSVKVIHRPTCAYGQRVYRWACQWRDPKLLAQALVASGAASHNRACGHCARDLELLVTRARDRRRDSGITPSLPEPQESGWVEAPVGPTVGPDPGGDAPS